MIELSTIRDLVAIFGVIAGFSYYVLTVRATRKNQQQQLETRQNQLFMQIYQELSSEETLQSFMELVNMKVDTEEYLQKYDSAVNPAHYAKRAHIWYSFNTIGELLRMGLIDRELLIRLQIDSMTILMWENWKDVIYETKKRENLPDIWEGFEYLYDEMIKYRNDYGYPKIALQKQPKTKHNR